MAKVSAVDRAVALLGPLEGRIMRAVWEGRVPDPCVVRDVQALMPELAYTTVMTTLSRLATKGLLTSRRTAGQRAFDYAPAGTPDDYLARSSEEEVEAVVERFGDAALAAFAAHLDALPAARRERLLRLAGR
jgi:predicted transcriptional regulator